MPPGIDSFRPSDQPDQPNQADTADQAAPRPERPHRPKVDAWTRQIAEDEAQELLNFLREHASSDDEPADSTSATDAAQPTPDRERGQPGTNDQQHQGDRSAEPADAETFVPERQAGPRHDSGSIAPAAREQHTQESPENQATPDRPAVSDRAVPTRPLDASTASRPRLTDEGVGWWETSPAEQTAGTRPRDTRSSGAPAERSASSEIDHPAPESGPGTRQRSDAADAVPAWTSRPDGQRRAGLLGPIEEATEGTNAERSEQRPELADRNKPVPVEGRDPDHRPIDPNEPRPRVEWRPGDPTIQLDTRYRTMNVHVRGDLVRPAQDDNGVGETTAWPNDGDTAWVKQVKTDVGKARAAEAVGADNWSNAKYAGEVFLDELPDKLKERFPAGVPFSHEGFPIFDHYAPVTVKFDDGFAPPRPDGRPDRIADERRANEIFGWRFTPKGMTWHHKEDAQTMVLVDSRLHDWVRHWGGERVTKIRESKRNPEC